MPICEIGRSNSDLCLKIATTVAAIENAAKRIATMSVVREKAFKPGKERGVTDALNRTAALRNDGKEGRFVGSEVGLTPVG
jgi:hypothetical protein